MSDEHETLREAAVIVGLDYQTAPERHADAQGSMLVYDSAGILDMKMDGDNVLMQLSIEAPGAVRMRLQLHGGHKVLDLDPLTGWDNSKDKLAKLIADAYRQAMSSP
jgi:hypothetical protein